MVFIAQKLIVKQINTTAKTANMLTITVTMMRSSIVAIL